MEVFVNSPAGTVYAVYRPSLSGGGVSCSSKVIVVPLDIIFSLSLRDVI